MTLDNWIARHPYLRVLADLHCLVAATAEGLRYPVVHVPHFGDYAGDFSAGVPLLLSTSLVIDMGPVEESLASLVSGLVREAPRGHLGEDIRALDAEVRGESNALGRAVAWLILRDGPAPAHPGLLQYLGWVTLARYLDPVLRAFADWRDEGRWLRNYCPACGAPPAMAQLVGVDPGRLRLLSCGHCGSLWRFPRTGCPFCLDCGDQGLRVLAVDEEAELRIDYCGACKGYLKTYSGEGEEGLLLADWTSLHLDVVARDRGLERKAASLYEMKAD